MEHHQDLPDSRREIELGERLAKGDLEARSDLCRANLRRVVDIAQGHTNQGLPLLDLITAANRGLIEALDSFDPQKGLSFSITAEESIKLSIRRAFAGEDQP